MLKERCDQFIKTFQEINVELSNFIKRRTVNIIKRRTVNFINR